MKSGRMAVLDYHLGNAEDAPGGSVKRKMMSIACDNLRHLLLAGAFFWVWFWVCGPAPVMRVMMVMLGLGRRSLGTLGKHANLRSFKKRLVLAYSLRGSWPRPAHVRACARACVRAPRVCVRACARVCVRACLCAWLACVRSWCAGVSVCGGAGAGACVGACVRGCTSVSMRACEVVPGGK